MCVCVCVCVCVCEVIYSMALQPLKILNRPLVKVLYVTLIFTLKAECWVISQSPQGITIRI